ncbi:Ama1p, partial [Ascoidea rubescens DSM 1968]
KRIKSHIPYRVLDAPNLKNDFYTNLVAWSSKTGKVGVGLGNNVYLWNEESGAIPLQTIDYEQVITALSFSDSIFLAVGLKNGRILLYDQNQEVVQSNYLNVDKGICCISWLFGTKKFFVGDEVGDVLLFEVVESNNSHSLYDLKLLKSFKCHQQQVCGIAISNDLKQVAIGGNDNCCTIWDVSDLENPKLKFSLPHQAAVKAISFCPWSNSLLATGGGSKDRRIRFWHTNSGTLLDVINTKGQITSLIWSKTKKQIVATFGFGDSEKPVLVAVYNYPKMQSLVQIQATPNLRILSAVPSPDNSSICVAANDETVRFYELWSGNPGIVPEAQECGVFGSDLIELCEGIDKGGDMIR